MYQPKIRLHIESKEEIQHDIFKKMKINFKPESKKVRSMIKSPFIFKSSMTQLPLTTSKTLIVISLKYSNIIPP